MNRLDTIVPSDRYNLIPAMEHDTLTISEEEQEMNLSILFNCLCKEGLSKKLVVTWLHRHLEAGNDEIALWTHAGYQFVASMEAKINSTDVIPVSWMQNEDGVVCPYEFVDRNSIRNSFARYIYSDDFQVSLQGYFSSIPHSMCISRYGVSILPHIAHITLMDVDIDSSPSLSPLQETNCNGKMYLSLQLLKATGVETSWCINQQKRIAITDCIISPDLF